MEVISSTCWYIPGSVQGVTTDFLIDSGSTYTIIDEELYYAIPDHQRSPLEQISLILRSANGETLNVCGQAKVSIELGRETFVCSVKVVTLGDKSAILGLDFMDEEDCVLHIAKGIIQINSKSIRLSLHKQTDSKCARIQLIEKICIPPMNEMIVPGKINQRHRNFDEAIGSIEPTGTICDATGLLVARTLVSTANNDVPIRLANTSSEPIVLQKGHTIALLHPVDADNIQVFGTCAQISSDNQQMLPQHLKCLMEKLSPELSSEEVKRVEDLLGKYADSFTDADGKVGKTHLVKHTINTGGAAPIKQRYRGVPMHKKEEVEEQLQKMQDNGEIEDSHSPWSSPLVIVPKKDGTLRICIDYRALNCVTVKDTYPLPRIDECLNSLAGALWYCTLDLASGYHQVMFDEEDKAKTAFSTRKGLKQWKVMPFGLCNAPASFQRLMELVLNGLQWEKCILYLDDVIVYGTDFDHTFKNLEMVLSRFKDANLKLKPSKCHLFQSSVEFLGHIVSREGIACDPKKIEAVKNWERPNTVKEVRSFVGFAQYYRKHIQNFSNIAAPLYQLTKKNAKFIWTSVCETAFQKLVELLSSAPILSFPTREDPFILDTDASLFGVGGVLSQIQNGEERVIAYGSKALSSSQRNYCTTMRELLAVVLFIHEFHHFLWGRHFTLRTDHASLTWLVNFKEPTGMLARWMSILGNYDFLIEHRKGVLHGNADGMSRLTPKKCKKEDCDSCALAIDACICIVTRSQARIIGGGLSGEEENPIGVGPNHLVAPMDIDVSSSSETDQGQILVEADVLGARPKGLQSRNALPPNWVESWSTEEIQTLQNKDYALNKILELKRGDNPLPDKKSLFNEDSEYKLLCNQWDKLEVHNNILYRRWTPQDSRDAECIQIVVPLELRKQILQMLHSHKSAGHLGIAKTLGKLRQRFYWPGHKKDVERWCKHCKICESLNRSLNPKKAPLQPKPTFRRMDRIACDLMGPVLTSEKGNSYVLVVCDYFSKYTEAYAIADMTAQTVADKIATEWVCRYGCPVSIHSDQGRQFESTLFQELCKVLDIHKTRTSRFHPQSDGVVERMNRTIKKMLQAMVDENPEQWDEHLPYAMMAYRATIHESTKCSPNLLLFGDENRQPVDLLYGECIIGEEVPICPSEYVEWVRDAYRTAFSKAREHLKTTAEKQKKLYDGNTFLRKFNIGNWVWVLNPPIMRNKFGRGWQGPFLIIKRLGDVNYVVQKGPNERQITIHIDHIKQYLHKDTPEPWVLSEAKYKEVAVQTEEN